MIKLSNLFLSVMMHLIIVLALFMTTRGGEGDGNKDEKEGEYKDDLVEIQIIPKPEKDPSKENNDEEGISINKYSTHLDNNGECKAFYGGIGIMQDFFTNKILEVYKGYPADKKGIKPGDTLEGKLERGEPGSIVHLTILRNNSIIEKDITRDKICYKE